MTDVDRIKNALAGLQVDPEDSNGDNVAILLCTYFEGLPDCPEDGELDEYDCWKQWAVDRYEALLKRMAEAAVEVVADRDEIERLRTENARLKTGLHTIEMAPEEGCNSDGHAWAASVAKSTLSGCAPRNADRSGDGEADTLRSAIAYATGTLGEAGDGLAWLRSWEGGDPEAMAELTAVREM